MKKIILIVTVLCICISFAGCATEEELLNENIIKLETRVSDLKSEISDLEEVRNTLVNEITDIKIENGTAKYIITFNIRQKHYSLNLEDHFKDAMNGFSVQIPVDKEFYDSVKIGDTIADNFRMGSLILKGSFGSWKITVKDKSVQ